MASSVNSWRAGIPNADGRFAHSMAYPATIDGYNAFLTTLLITVLLYARANGFRYKPAVTIKAAARLYGCYDCSGKDVD